MCVCVFSDSKASGSLGKCESLCLISQLVTVHLMCVDWYLK